MTTNQHTLDLDAGRPIGRTDNNPPEALPPQLAAAEELVLIMKGDIDGAVEKAVLELDIYSRVPESIENDEIYQRVTTLATRIKDVLDDADKKRKVHKEPYLKAGKLVDDSFNLILPVKDEKDRVLKKELEAAHGALKRRLSDYDTRQYLAEQAVADAERAKIALDAAQDGIQMDATPADAAIASTVKSAHGGHSVRRLVTEWSVTDEALLPRSVLSIDPAKVEKLIAGGATEIPGIVMSKKVDTHVKKR